MEKMVTKLKEIGEFIGCVDEEWTEVMVDD